MKKEMKEILTIQEVCREIGVSPMTLFRLRQQGILHGHQFAEGRTRTVYFLRSEIMEALKAVDNNDKFI